MGKIFTRIAVAVFILVAVTDPTSRAALTHAATSARDYVMAQYRSAQGEPATGTTAAAAAGSAGSFTIARHNSNGTPIRWNPCAAVHVVVNTAHAPAGAMTAARTAVARVSAASGLKITIDGTTATAPRSSYPTRRYAGRSGWAPVLLAWGPPGTGPLGTDGTSGVGMPAWVDGPQGAVYVSGQIVLNSDQNELYAHGYGSSREVALLEHEFGHILGLDHVADPSQVMNPQVGAAADLGAGDRAGLAAVGAGGCLATPAPSWG